MSTISLIEVEELSAHCQNSSFRVKFRQHQQQLTSSPHAHVTKRDNGRKSGYYATISSNCGLWSVSSAKHFASFFLASAISDFTFPPISSISTDLSIPSNLVVAFMRDRVSVNSVAMRTVSVLYNSMVNIGCFSHTLDLVGEHMNIPILNEFTKHWISLFSLRLLELVCLLLLTPQLGGGAGLK